MLFVVFVSAVLALSAPAVQGQVFGWGRCPNVPVDQNIQLDSYLGTWVATARFPTANTKSGNMDCVTANNRRLEDGKIQWDISGVRDGLRVDVINALGVHGVENPEEPAKISVPLSSFSFLPKLIYVILEMDNDPQTGYYVGYICKDIWVANVQFLYVMSKERRMDKTKLNGILGRLEGYGIDTSKLRYPRQDDTCPALS